MNGAADKLTGDQFELGPDSLCLDFEMNEDNILVGKTFNLYSSTSEYKLRQCDLQPVKLSLTRETGLFIQLNCLKFILFA